MLFFLFLFFTKKITIYILNVFYNNNELFTSEYSDRYYYEKQDFFLKTRNNL